MAVIATTWAFFPATGSDSKRPPSAERQAEITLCSQAKTENECSDILKAAGRNPFDAFDFTWGKSGLLLPDEDVGLLPPGWWETIRLSTVLALTPPILLLVLGYSAAWIFRGFKNE